ncbi:MAG: L,D-transpeptidase [Phyllobacteriaceae bacterium]|nr:L,D-transpeptidase [Phyllobacteriaceae bacterium]
MILAPLVSSLLLTATSPLLPAAPENSVQLAMGRDVIVIVDNRGRRVVIDRWSGEVLALLPPKRALRREDRRDFHRPRLKREWRDEEWRDDAHDDDEEAPADVIAPRVKPKAKIAKKAPAKRKPAETEEPVVITATTSKAPKTDMPEDSPFPSAAIEAIAKLQIVLDRAGVSPGAIDGRPGDNLDKALDAYEQKFGERLDPADATAIERALSGSGGAAFTSYTVTTADAAGPFVASIPADYGQKASLDRLSYTSTLEMLAERFHMSETYLKALNPQAAFSRPGARLTVAASGVRASGSVAKIIADKGRKQVRAYDSAGRLVAAYPATIGSSDTPSPSGTVAVDRVAFDPEYTYNPKVNFQQGANSRVLTIPPGPNGPVGTIWIALSKPTYGIHGTPEPEKIGKTNSHGCVRLTNWDAEELARLVKPGVSVLFVE